MAIAIPRQDVEIDGRLYRITKSGHYLLHAGGVWVDERDLPHESRPWRPFVQTIPFQPAGQPPYEFSEGETFWSNSHYLVFKRMFVTDAEVDGAHLSMRTVENDVRHDWREMQRVKNEILGEDWEAVELYPAERRVVDMANQFHLWAFPHEIPIGFPVKDSTAVRMTAAEAAKTGATQRPREDEQ